VHVPGDLHPVGDASLANTLPTCVLTVATPMWSDPATSEFVSPSLTATATSRSRSVSRFSSARALPWRPSSPGRVTAAIRWDVTLGESIGSPTATRRTASTRSAGEVSLSRNPAAPCWSAVRIISSVSKVVRTMIRAAVPRSRRRRAAASPSITGILMSIRTTSGASRSTTRIALCPSDASPTTSWAPPRIIRRPARTSGSSSTTTTRTVLSPATAASPARRTSRRAAPRAPAPHRPAPPARSALRDRPRRTPDRRPAGYRPSCAPPARGAHRVPQRAAP